MYYVSLVNFTMWFKEPVDSIDEAINLGKSSGFEFAIYKKNGKGWDFVQAYSV